VIVELVIDTAGKVSSAQVIRSIPPFDEAALAAVRQWEYEVTRVDGKPVSVKLTVPITFAMKIPEIASRQEGIPELRAGAFPPLSKDAREPGAATAEITLDPDGNVEELRIVSGPPAYADALARALRTWRFAPETSEATVTFMVHAEFNPARDAGSKVSFRLDGLRRSESLATATPNPVTPGATRDARAGAGAEPTAPPPDATIAEPAPPSATPLPAAPTAPAGPAPDPPSVTVPPVPPPTIPTAASFPASPAAAQSVPPSTPPPAVEVLSVAPPPEPPENGLSAIRDVTLTPGVPDLTRGRRPVPPPLARMAQAEGTIAVSFSVDAAGIASVKGSNGPEIFKRAAEQAVSSWTFRRTRADRLFLVAEFKYTPDTAAATVRPDVR
jgi:TonB family protein